MKAFFIDADGTLLEADGSIRDSARQALKMLQAAGHKIVLSTGRQLCQIYGALASIDFDGMICGAGSCIVAGQDVLQDIHFDKAQMEALRAIITAHGIPGFYECAHDLYIDGASRVLLQQIMDQEAEGLDPWQVSGHAIQHILNIAKPLEAADFPVPAAKYSFFRAKEPYPVLAALFDGPFLPVPASYAPFGKGAGEVSLACVSKGSGVGLLADAFGIGREDCIAVGDSWNDLPMFEACGQSAAMGNAPDGVKEKAGFVGPAIEEDGLAVILRSFV